MEGKSMKRSERRHRSRMARRRKYRMVGDVCGVNLREAPVKREELETPLQRFFGAYLLPRHKWLQMEHERMSILDRSRLRFRKELRRGGVSEDSVLVGKKDPRNFDLVEDSFFRMAMGILSVRFPEIGCSCSCFEWEWWGDEKEGCDNCIDFDQDRHLLRLELSSLSKRDRLSLKDKVEFSQRLDRYRDKFFGG